MKEGRRLHCALSLGNDIVVFGGRDTDGHILASIDYFDWNLQKWTTKGVLHLPRFYLHLIFKFITACNLIRYEATGVVVEGDAYGLKVF